MPISPRQDVAALADLREDVAHDVAGRRRTRCPRCPPPWVKINVLMPTSRALGVDERTAAVAGIDGGVRLDVDHGVVGLQLPGDGADHAHGHRRVEAQRAAERHHDLAGPQRVRVAEWQTSAGPTLSILMHRQVGLVIDGHDSGGNDAPAALHDRPTRGDAARRGRQLDLEPGRVLDNMGVGDDVAVGIDDGTRAAGALDAGSPVPPSLCSSGGA